MKNACFHRCTVVKLYALKIEEKKKMESFLFFLVCGRLVVLGLSVMAG